MLTYLLQIKENIIRILYPNKSLAVDGELTKQPIKSVQVSLENNIDAKIRLKCACAEKELRYIKNFTHWPVSVLKPQKKTALVRYEKSKGGNCPPNKP